jgi:hypothetical protein
MPATNMSVGVCNTQACLDIAKEILTSLAPNYQEVDPCADFDTCKIRISPSAAFYLKAY